MKCIITEESKTISKLVKRHGTVKIADQSFLRGEFKIKSFRQYRYRVKISVEFRGEIYSKFNNKWYSVKDLPKLSKIKAFRLIRRSGLNEINLRLKIFGTSLKYYDDIDKLKWVG